MNSGYRPKVANPNMSNNIVQMRSEMNQVPFYFGGSQVPMNLLLSKDEYSGSGFVGDVPPNNKFTDSAKFHILKTSINK